MSLHSFSMGTIGGALSMAAVYSTVRTKIWNDFESMRRCLQQLENGFQAQQIEENNSIDSSYFLSNLLGSRTKTIWNDVIVRIGKSITGSY